MNVLEAVILGIVQGMAEFLPISSSGHLVLFQNLFAIKENSRTFDILLHIGTLIPILIIFREDVLALIRNPFQKMTALLIVGTLPAVAATLLFGDKIDALFEGGLLLGIAFIVTGLFLLYADGVWGGYKKDKDITYLDALVVGFMQAVGIPPGVSRSGSTITGALTCGLSRETAAKFSFLLSIPAILGAAVLEIKKVMSEGDPLMAGNMAGYVFGFVAAMLTGYLSIKFMLKLIKECKLKYFSYYVFILGVLILADSLFTHIVF